MDEINFQANTLLNSMQQKAGSLNRLVVKVKFKNLVLKSVSNLNRFMNHIIQPVLPVQQTTPLSSQCCPGSCGQVLSNHYKLKIQMLRICKLFQNTESWETSGTFPEALITLLRCEGLSLLVPLTRYTLLWICPLVPGQQLITG